MLGKYWLVNDGRLLPVSESKTTESGDTASEESSTQKTAVITDAATVIQTGNLLPRRFLFGELVSLTLKFKFLIQALMLISHNRHHHCLASMLNTGWTVSLWTLENATTGNHHGQNSQPSFLPSTLAKQVCKLNESIVYRYLDHKGQARCPSWRLTNRIKALEV